MGFTIKYGFSKTNKNLGIVTNAAGTLTLSVMFAVNLLLTNVKERLQIQSKIFTKNVSILKLKINRVIGYHISYVVFVTHKNYVSSVTKPTLCCNELVKNIKTSENIEVVEKNVVSALKEIAIETYSHEEYASNSSASNSNDNDEDEFIPPGQQKKPEFYTQESLNDLIRDLGLPKNAAEHLASDLKKRNLVMKGTQSTVYRIREKAFLNFFSRESDLVYCSDVNGLMNELKPNIR